MSIFTSRPSSACRTTIRSSARPAPSASRNLGTPFTRQMLVDTQPKQFDTLISLSGFSHGTDVWAGNIHDLIVNGIANVNETVGCRDDIMLYLISVGIEPSLAFKTMEAVRKGQGQEERGVSRRRRTADARQGVPDWYIESCRKIAYLFPKAHAVAYVMMAFRIAWFKVHLPLAFYSAYFYRRSQKGGFDAGMMTGGADAVRRKINNAPARISPRTRRICLSRWTQSMSSICAALSLRRSTSISPTRQSSNHRGRQAPPAVRVDLRPRRRPPRSTLPLQGARGALHLH